MQKKIYLLFMTLVGVSLGISFLPPIWELLGISHISLLNNKIIDGTIGALIFLILAFITYSYLSQLIKSIEKILSEKSLYDIIFGSAGMIVGLVVGALVSIPLYAISLMLPIAMMLLFGYLGLYVGTSRKDDLRKLMTPRAKKGAEDVLERKVTDNFHKYKILDTSVIIDGRIYDIAKTGFLEGVLLIPNFVLYELQYIADSGDSLKRVRGRRGLDILNSLQKEENIFVEMYDGDFEDISEVDSKLIKLAKLLDGVIVTNDYNLNKVSEFQNVPVLNINALANSVKPVVIPGETMTVMVVKGGTERQQGVAYLDDGTMVVVEDGKHYMNQTIKVVVTSALQTAAGRMIFAKPSHSQKGLTENTEK